MASLLPDIDTTKSTLGRLLSPLSRFLDKHFGHRTITHSFIGCFIVALVLMPVFFFRPDWYKALCIGYCSHLVIDCINKTGVPFFWPNNTYAVFPGNPRWRIEVGSLGEYILCGFLILLTAGAWYLNGVGLRSWFSSILATPQMAVSEYRNFANTHRMNVKVKGFYGISQEAVNDEVFPVVDAIDDTTLLVKSKQGHLITIGKSPENTIQAQKAVIQKINPAKIQSDNFIFRGNAIELMLPYLTEDTYVSGTVEAHTQPRYIKMDMKPFKSGEFESIKVSPGLSEFDAKLEFKDASFEQIKRLSGVPVSGELVSRQLGK